MHLGSFRKVSKCFNIQALVLYETVTVTIGLVITRQCPGVYWTCSIREKSFGKFHFPNLRLSPSRISLSHPHWEELRHKEETWARGQRVSSASPASLIIFGCSLSVPQPLFFRSLICCIFQWRRELYVHRLPNVGPNARWHFRSLLMSSGKTNIFGWGWLVFPFCLHHIVVLSHALSVIPSGSPCVYETNLMLNV